MRKAVRGVFQSIFEPNERESRRSNREISSRERRRVQSTRRAESTGDTPRRDRWSGGTATSYTSGTTAYGGRSSTSSGHPSNLPSPPQVNTPRSRYRIDVSSRRSRENSLEDRQVDEAPYEAKPFDGEYDIWFTFKPLGVGLVPSTQLYGTWEVSAIMLPPPPAPGTAPGASSTTPSASPRMTPVSSATTPTARSRMASAASPSMNSPARSPMKTPTAVAVGDTDRTKIQRGDVIIAVDRSRSKARLPRAEFAQYLQRTPCPIVITFRRPEAYGSLDSRSMSTAMYPASIEYRDHLAELKFGARASSEQWRRGLYHELARNARKSKRPEVKQLAAQLANLPEHSLVDHCEASTPSPATSAARSNGETFDLGPMPSTRASLKRCPSADLSPMGEFEYTFHEEPIHLTLAPSTRLYGSVEVYDPKMHAPILQVGDVIMAVNGDTTVSRWSTDDLMDYLSQLHAPITVSFRRPTAYRQYLERYFRSSKAISSSSVVTSMFPETPEYKKPSIPAKPVVKQRNVLISPPVIPVKTPQSSDAIAALALTSSLQVDQPSAPVQTMNELREFSLQMNEAEQFKKWSSGAGKQVSEILTEKHVRFLYKHLPRYLSCNDLEPMYTTRKHGWNLLSFYSNLEGRGPSIVVVKDLDDNIFGAFCSASWKKSESVFGNGRSFVFTLRPRMHVYAWSGVNDSFMYGRRDALFIGGGKQGTALCVQLDDEQGFTQPCDTFNSPPLCERENFQCAAVEVWCFSGLRV